ncbi:replication initiator [Brachybacterium tyrofermentans]|uniref:replication initiator n=1 Tax=Brachybacterium tyrofermentans TaxID=47848 RepID=UPI003FD108B8
MDDALLAGYVSSRMPGAGTLPDLDLGELSDSARETAEMRARTGRWAAWSESAARVGWCSHPLRLRGSSTTVNSGTGAVESFSSSQSPDGFVRVPCGNRRADKCPACSRVYARDTFELIRTGLLGGKQVPETVADNPLVFATMTAPSFGRVHGVRDGKRCRPRHDADACPHGRMQSCHAVHGSDDELVGAPLCWECYDSTSALVWQWHAPELWRRATIALRRAVAGHLGVTGSGLRKIATVQYAKVAEFQARGLVHFHALIRLDGPDGPGSPAPIDGLTLANLVKHAVLGVRVDAPPIDGADVPRVLRFGVQLDARTVRTGRPGDLIDDSRTSDELHAGQVAGYLAKYATKATSESGIPRPHLQRMERQCWVLSKRAYAADDESPYVLLGKWSRMLGFRGHFSTKSRAYSVTLGRLRAARRRFARLKAESDRSGVPLDVVDLEMRLLAEDETTLVVSSSWEFVGCGWGSGGEKELAEAAAARAREYARLRSELRNAG